MKPAREPASNRPRPCASLKKPHESCPFAAPCGPRRKKNDRGQRSAFPSETSRFALSILAHRGSALPWLVNVIVVVSHIQRIGCQLEKTTLYCGQSRSWSAEQGKENKRKSLAAYPPPTPHTARSEKIHEITRRIHRRYAGLGRSPVRTRIIPSARRLGQWVWLREILHSRLR